MRDGSRDGLRDGPGEGGAGRSGEFAVRPRDDRDAQLERVAALLDHGRGALVVVRGAAGSGRRTFLRDVRGRALRRGWRERSPEPARRLSIDRRTTVTTFLAELGARADGPTGPARVAPPATAEAALRLLGGGPPVLVTIASYDASAEFDTWFRGELRRALAGAPTPVLLVVTGESAALQELARDADQVIDLVPLGPADVERQLRRAASRVSPPLGEDELRRYVDAGVGHPAVLRALLRLLDALAPADPSTAGGPTRA